MASLAMKKKNPKKPTRFQITIIRQRLNGF